MAAKIRRKQFEDQIANILKRGGFDFEVQPAIGGLIPDFLVTGPKGERVVIEAKNWSPDGGNVARAAEQALHYRKVTGADSALMVIPQLKRRISGVVGSEALTDERYALMADSKPKRRRPGTVGKPANRMIFAAMPIARTYDDTYLVAMSHAARAVNATCQRVDRTEFSGDVVEEIKRLIRNCAAVIADLSESNPNVLYEAGFAHALAKPTIQITSTKLNDLPFNVRNRNTIEYNTGQISGLVRTLTKRLRAELPA